MDQNRYAVRSHVGSRAISVQVNIVAGIGERAVRRVKEGTSAVLLQSGLDEMLGRFYGMLYLSAKHSRSLV